MKTLESDSSSEVASSNPSTPHSPSQSLPTLTGAAMGLRVLEARLQVNVARLGKMNPFVRVVYDQQVWSSNVSSRQGTKPKWNAYHVFERTEAQFVVVEVLHRALMLGDVEVGRCMLQLSDVLQGHQTDWWPLLLSNGDVAGTILLTFEFPQDDSLRLTTLSSQGSLDREDLGLDTERGDPLHFPSQDFRFEKSRPRSGLPEGSRALLEENQVLKLKDMDVQRLFDRAKEEDLKQRKVKADIAKFRESLRKREAALSQEETRLKTEQESIRKQREELAFMRGQLNHDAAKLRQEKAKLQQLSQEIETAATETSRASVKLTKELAALKKQAVSRPRDSAEDLREQTQLQQVRDTLADKQRILHEHLEQVRLQREQVRLERQLVRRERDAQPLHLEEQWGLLSQQIDRHLSPVHELMRYPSSSS